MKQQSAQANKSSLSEEIYLRIRRALIEGSLAEGQRLSEPELALKFKASRSPVREALVRLEHEGFVGRTDSGRVYVRPLEIEDLRQLYIVRATLEGLAARLAAPRLRTIDLENMQSSIEQMERHVSRRNAAGAIEVGEAFHEVIIRECANAPLQEVLSGLRARISRYRAVVASFRDYDPERIAEHKRILKAFYQRDPGQAEAEMTRHVERSAAVLIDRLRKMRGG